MSNITFKGLNIRFEYSRAQAPIGNIIFLHTIGKTLEDYDPLIPFFQNNYNILRYDLFGHGQSDLPTEPITIDLLKNQLAFMANQFFNETFFLIANPASGYVATRYCRYNYPRVAGLVLLSPPPTFLPLQERQNIVNQMKERASRSYEDFKKFLISNLTVKEDLDSFSKVKAQFDQTTERAYFEFMGAYITENLNEDFKHIHSPILVLAGAKDTLFPTSIHGITANFIGAQFSIISNASTLVAFDNPKATADAIQAFLLDTKSTAKGFLLNQKIITTSLFNGFYEEKENIVLSVELINTFRVRVGDEEITIGWNLRKAKSLLLFLLFHRSATREEIINHFWPELEINKARNHLRVSLNHLKSLLNRIEGQPFLYVDRGNIFLQGSIEFDGLAYQEELKRVHNLTDPAEKLEYAQRILQTSPHKLVTHIYDDWFLVIRDSIEAEYSYLCLWVAEQFKAADRNSDAVKYIEKAEKVHG